MKSMHRLVANLLLMAVIMLFANSVNASCVKGKHVPLTSGNQELCDQEEKLDLEKKKQELKEEQEKLDARKQGINNNSGLGSGEKNVNVVLGSLLGQTGNAASNSEADMKISKHQFRVELAFYTIPAAQGFDEPQMPEVFMVNGLAYEWYLNKNFGIGFLWQRYNVTQGKDFDPITVQKEFTETVDVVGADGTTQQATRTVTREVPVYFPGAINRISYERRLFYVTGNAELFSPVWNGVFRFGTGQSIAHIEYDDIDTSNERYKYAKQPQNVSHNANQTFYLDLGVERWTVGVKMGACFRFINAAPDTTDVMEYIGLGGSEFVFYVQLNIPGLGQIQ